jgi:uncharacterized protein YkwD
MTTAQSGGRHDVLGEKGLAVRHRLALALGLAVMTLATPAGTPITRAAAYDHFYANFSGEELMRAMNADRAALGLGPLATDAVLESIARDRPTTCPSNLSLTIRGRARDMADRNYLSHSITGCTDSSGAFDAFDLLHRLGYTFVRVAEAIADNSYPASAATYATGCSLGGSSCHGSTVLPWTVAVAERQFMSSTTHRASILTRTYDRFGCGAWASTSGFHYYACYFVQTGNGYRDGTPPVISKVSGSGGVFARGSRPTFTATATDAHSELSDGWAAIDGVRIRNWAWDHVGSSAGLSATAPALKSGMHTFTWWVRDTSTHGGSVSFHFSVP